MSKLIREPIRPYRWAFWIVPAGVLVETAAVLAGALPLKNIVDKLVSTHHLPMWLADSVGPLPGGASKMRVAALAALLLVAMAVANAIARQLGNSRSIKVIRIKGGTVGEESTHVELNEAQYETKAALAA